MAYIFLAAASISETVEICISAIFSASGIFGVSTSASGITVSIKVETAVGFINGQPFLAYITGSITTFWGLYCNSFFATAFIHSGVESIPIFTASTSISSNTASICFSIISGVISWMSITRLVFSATTETITLIPNTP